MKRIIRKFRKWIKYKFSTYYPDPCDFTIYESYDTPARQRKQYSDIFDSLLYSQQDVEDMFTAGGRYRQEWELCIDTSKYTVNHFELPTYENPPPPPPPPFRTITEGNFSNAFKRVEKTKPLPNPLPNKKLPSSTTVYQDRWQKLSPEFRAQNSAPMEKFDKLYGLADVDYITSEYKRLVNGKGVSILTPPDPQLENIKEQFDEIFK